MLQYPLSLFSSHRLLSSSPSTSDPPFEGLKKNEIEDVSTMEKVGIGDKGGERGKGKRKRERKRKRV
jgi:hypothetical protein